jgi:DNA-binding response OmpR family regulator
MSVVLVVDDEPDMLEIVAAFLSHEHRVLCATDVPGARAILATEACDLVITDIRMPGASGRALIDWLAARHPSVRVVVVSGFDRDESLEVSRWLAKPFRRAELRAAVQDALGT